MKFRKKPVVIEAVHFTGENVAECKGFAGSKMEDVSLTSSPMLIIYTLEGEMRCRQGDWIIKGVKGEFYPCKNDIFEATYEAVYDSGINRTMLP